MPQSRRSFQECFFIALEKVSVFNYSAISTTALLESFEGISKILLHGVKTWKLENSKVLALKFPNYNKLFFVPRKIVVHAQIVVIFNFLYKTEVDFMKCLLTRLFDFYSSFYYCTSFQCFRFFLYILCIFFLALLLFSMMKCHKRVRRYVCGKNRIKRSSLLKVPDVCYKN